MLAIAGGGRAQLDDDSALGPDGFALALDARIASIDLVGSVATVRLELDDWTGDRFTDLFTLLKVDGEWKIMNKVFHLHT